jgi:hypothetical protein
MDQLHNEEINSIAAAERILERAFKNRSQGFTHMNATSSRSHMCLTLQVTLSSMQTSCITIVDLAGSERIQDTQATGETAKEAAKINMSLMVISKPRFMHRL